jgi:hypothetical protein
MNRILPKRDARANFAKHRRALVRVGLNPGLAESDGRGDPANSSADDDGFQIAAVFRIDRNVQNRKTIYRNTPATSRIRFLYSV